MSTNSGIDDEKEAPQRASATVLEVLGSFDRRALLEEIRPPEDIPVCHWALWALAKTTIGFSKSGDTARVSAAKELLDRLYGKVPVVERVENVTSIESLDLSRLTPHERQVLRSLLEKAGPE